MSRLIQQCLFVLTLFVVTSMASAATLRVGLSPDYPPLQYKQDGRVVGIEADNARAVGEILGRQVKVVELPFAELLPALEAGKVDVIMSGLSITDQRSERVLFTQPYLQVGQMSIMHRDKVARFAQPWAIYREGIRIGVEPGTTGASFAEAELKDAQVKYFDDPPAAFAGLRGDVIDLYIHDAPTSWQLANSSENDDLISLYSPLTDESLAWAVALGNGSLLQELNRALDLMKANGTLSYILNRWIPVKVEVSR